MDKTGNVGLAQTLLTEISVIEQLSQAQFRKALPKGMEMSHFSVLHHFTKSGGEKTPAQLARMFHVTKGAMTNTLSRLQKAGYVNIRPDWDDGRRKRVSINDEGIAACTAAMLKVEPILEDLAATLNEDRLRTVLPLLHQIRTHYMERE